jgi:predicted acyltransferase
MSDTTIHSQDTEAGSPVKAGTRLIALDAFRGITIALMLLVNNFGGAAQAPTQLKHAGWEGTIHLADLAFPWFLLCVGIAIPFSVASAAKKGITNWRYALKVVKRIAILLALGAILDTSGDWRITWFSIGVLQTIAIAYGFGALLYDLSGHRRLTLAGLGLVAYWACIKYLPIPGEGVGLFQEQHNFILHLNRSYLGEVGLWGLPRIVPTAALTLIGTIVGDMLRRADVDKRRKALWLLTSGLLIAVLGYLWSLSLPFNKWVWTPSYVLACAGAGLLLLGIVYCVTDIAGKNKWAFPFVVFGSNAIIAYVLPIAMKQLLLSPFGIYVYTWPLVIGYTLFWWVILWLLYRKKLFLRA